MSEVVDHQTGQRDLIGKLALQLHAGPPMKIEFRNARLKRLPLENMQEGRLRRRLSQSRIHGTRASGRLPVAG